jgi:hypothetical protein
MGGTNHQLSTGCEIGRYEMAICAACSTMEESIYAQRAASALRGSSLG